MARISQQRRKSFDEFYNKAINTFKALRDSDPRAGIFEAEYVLNICPGSRRGGRDKAVVEIFWGARPFDFETTPRTWSAMTEYGASLVFLRNDNGFVTVYLYPAHTDNQKPVETAIIVIKRLNPLKLRRQSIIKSLWDDFMAYMEVTSLDGDPSIWQRFRIWQLRTSRRLILDTQITSTRLSKWAERMLFWFVTVGCSGIIVAYISFKFLQPPSPSPTENKLDAVNRNLEAIIKQIDQLPPPVDTTKLTPNGNHTHLHDNAN